MDNLRRVLLTPTTTPVPPVTNITNTTSSSPSVIASPMAKPAPFTGVAEQCNGFLLQCSLALEMQPHLYATDRAKIAFIISLLTGRVLQWAETIWTQSSTVTQSVNSFIEHFREVFGRPAGRWFIRWRTAVSSPSRIAVNNWLCSQFRTLAAASGWNERSLLTSYRQGLEPRVRLQLSAYDDSYGLERFIQLSIRCANPMQSCFMESQNSPSSSLLRHPATLSPPEPGHEPMQIDQTRLSSSEWQRRLTQGLCLYCGAGGHVISTCSIRPPRPMVSVIKPVVANMQPLTAIVILTASNVCVPVHALLDSGSAGNFISGSLCHQLNLLTTATTTTYQVQSVTGKTLSRRHVKYSAGPIHLQVGQLHKESIHLLVLEWSTAEIILGRPWFMQHDPVISWSTGEVLKWGNQCFPDCFPHLPRPSTRYPRTLAINSTSIESPREKQSVEIPACYAPFSDVFCPKRASQLPPHWPSVTGWVSAPWKDLPTLTSRTEGHGGVYWRCSSTRLHSPFNVPCCFELFLRVQEGRRLAALYRLPGTQQDHRKVPLSSSSRPSGTRTSPRSHRLLQVGPPQCI